MSLLFDAHQLGRQQTGNEVWVRNVIRAMQPLTADDEIEYAVTDSGTEEIRALTESRSHLVSGSSAKRLAIDLPHLARSSRCAAVYVTYTAPLTRRPVVVQVHDVAAWYPESAKWLSPSTRLQYRTTVGWSCRVAHHVLATSEAARADLVRFLGLDPAKVSVALAALDPELESLLSSDGRPGRGPTFRVLAVGNVLPRKNLIVLAEAVRSCRSSGLDIQLRIVGTAADTSLCQQIREHLGPSVHFTGYVTQRELAEEYRAADVFAFPSLLEGFGIPVLEAMSAGVPVVVSNAGALPEVAGDAALVREGHDRPGWADALTRLYEDGDLREALRQKGFRQARRFSWEAAARIVLERLRAAADGSAGASRRGAHGC